MYTSFYKLHAKPFQISSDPDFIWLGEKHKEALATLKYGVLDNKGFLLLTGDVGTGKTTLINTLIQSLSDDIIFTSVTDPSLSKLDFFNYIAASFNIDHEFSSKGAFLVRFQKFLLEAYENNKKVLLIIDEAQLLTQELLEEIRLLSNIEKTNTKLINIFFVGQNEFNEILNQNQNRAVRQRLTLNYNIDPLTPDETDEYIKHRLKVAGTTQAIFEPSAVQEVFMYSGGFPRRINIICDHALLSGYVKDSQTIDANIVRECAKELIIPTDIRNRDINGFADASQKPVANIRSPQVILAPRLPEEKKKRRANIFTWLMASILFFVVCWWILFPSNFQGMISNTHYHFKELKSKALQKVPDTLKTYLITDKPNGLDKKVDEIKTVETPTPLVQDAAGPANQDKGLIEDTNQSSDNPDTPIDGLENETIYPVDQPEVIKKKPPLPRESITIRFKYNTNDFTREGYERLQAFADVLILYPDTKVRIAGYTDSEGYENYNIKLSEFRANIVRSFFLGTGLGSNQFEIKGYGSQNPIESNDTAWGRMMNRRVEIQVLATEKE